MDDPIVLKHLYPKGMSKQVHEECQKKLEQARVN